MPRRAHLDANVVLRLLVGDPPEMAARARILFEGMERGEVTLVLDTIVVAECVWTLRSYYRRSVPDVAGAMRELLLLPNLVAEERDSLITALAWYESLGVDFVDALLAARMQAAGDRDVYSFDQHFDRLPSVKRLQP